MLPFILVSTRRELNFLRFPNKAQADRYCEKMARCGIEYKMEVF